LNLQQQQPRLLEGGLFPCPPFWKLNQPLRLPHSFALALVALDALDVSLWILLIQVSVQQYIISQDFIS
jgi:hypothetical protein